MYDVIVVGGGPSGAMAAKTCSENGLNVLLIEKKLFLTFVLIILRHFYQ